MTTTEHVAALALTLPRKVEEQILALDPTLNDDLAAWHDSERRAGVYARNDELGGIHRPTAPLEEVHVNATGLPAVVHNIVVGALVCGAFPSG